MRRPGVRIPLPPAFALRDEKRRLSRRRSRGDRRRTSNAIWPPFLKDYGLAGQPSSLMMRLVRRSDGRLLLRLHTRSESDEKMHYSGVTRDLIARLCEHNRGKCPHTSKNRPWKIETAVAFRSEAKARRFERYIKTGSGREFARRHF